MADGQQNPNVPLACVRADLLFRLAAGVVVISQFACRQSSRIRIVFQADHAPLDTFHFRIQVSTKSSQCGLSLSIHK